MMVRFDSQAGAGFSMFEKDARQMISLMGHSDTIPGAVRGEDVAAVLQTLQDNLSAATEPEAPAEGTNDDEPPPIPLNRRAWPLLELLKTASAKKAIVTWEFNSSAF